MNSTAGIQNSYFTSLANFKLSTPPASSTAQTSSTPKTDQAPKVQTPAQSPPKGSALQEAEETLTQTRLEAAAGDQQAILKLAGEQGPKPTTAIPGVKVDLTA